MEETIMEILEHPETAPTQEVTVDTATTDSKEQTFGKYKNEHELVKAYENLQVEYTRKSQELSKLTAAMGEWKVASESQREMIIAEYLKEISARQTSPRVITNANGLGIGFKPVPPDLKECNSLAEHYFRGRN